MRAPRSIVAAAIAVALAAGACDNAPADSDPVAGSFVGRVDGTEAFVAVVSDGEEVRAYVCDGTPERSATMSEWFKGAQSGTAIDFASMSGAARLVATVTDVGASGRIERTGLSTLTFSATAAVAPSGFHLFKKLVGGELYWAGWIVLPGGEHRGSMASPTKTSIGVELETSSGTAQLPDAGTVRPGLMTTTNLRAGMCGPPLCPGFP